MSKIIILENGTRDEACKKYNSTKSEINDFTKESVSMRGNIKNPDEGWTVVKIIK